MSADGSNEQATSTPEAVSPEESASPLRSVLAVAFGVIVFIVLGTLSTQALTSSFPSNFHAPNADGLIPPPNTQMLQLMLGAMVLNAALSAFVCIRIARVAPHMHGIILAAYLGFQGTLSMGQLRGWPGWFALLSIVLPIATMIAMGFLIRRLNRQNAGAASGAPHHR